MWLLPSSGSEWRVSAGAVTLATALHLSKITPDARGGAWHRQQSITTAVMKLITVTNIRPSSAGMLRQLHLCYGILLFAGTIQRPASLPQPCPPCGLQLLAGQSSAFNNSTCAMGYCCVQVNDSKASVAPTAMPTLWSPAFSRSVTKAAVHATPTKSAPNGASSAADLNADSVSETR